VRSVLLVGFGFLLLTGQAALATLVPMHTFAPNLVLPIALSLGVSADVHLVRGAMICFVLGYLLDAFCGNPMGLQTFVLVASFMLARAAASRLLPHGGFFTAMFTLTMSIASGFAILALRALFEKKGDILTHDVLSTFQVLLQSSLATALLSPPIFAAVRRIDGRLSSKADERASLA
jgi:rod shape-determining protein MreD